MTIEGATVIRTGHSIGGGYDKIFLKTVDGRIVVLQAETTSDDDKYVGIIDMLDTLKRRIKRCEEYIKNCEEKVKEIAEW